MSIKTLISTIIIWLMLYGAGHSAMPVNPSYVSTTGATYPTAACTLGDPCSLSYAAANADDNDVVYLRGGNYGSQQLIPTNSGSSGNVITFARYAAEIPSFTRTGGPSVYLSGKSYIAIDGLTFTGGTIYSINLVSGSNYNEIKNCTFQEPTAGYYPLLSLTQSHYNYIHNNIFTNTTFAATGEGDENDFIWLSDADYNRIISNNFTDGMGHAFIWLSGVWSNYDGSDNNIIRSNTMTVTSRWNANDKQSLDVFVGGEAQSNSNVVELNTMTQETNAAAKCYPLQLNRSKYWIFRKNTISGLNGIVNLYIVSGTIGNHVEYNNAYNNTFYNVGNYSANYALWHLDAITGYYNRYNQFTNNIVKTVVAVKGIRLGFNDGYAAPESYFVGNQARNNAWYNDQSSRVYIDRAAGDVNFTSWANADADATYTGAIDTSGTIITETTFTDLIDFEADDGAAPQVDAGAWLTTVNGGTTSKTFVVDDYPYMLYYGNGISGETGDTIKTQNGQTCVIESINYVAKQITCVDPITVVDGEGIALSYNGTAPDIGAKEYGGTPPVPAENFIPANEAAGISTTVDLTFDGQTGETFDIYFDATDCTTLQCDDAGEVGGTVTCDVGTLANSDTFYWKVHANTANQDFPSTGCFTFTTIGTPPNSISMVPNSGGINIKPSSGGINIVPR